MTYQDALEENPLLSPYNWAIKWVEHCTKDYIYTPTQETHISIPLALQQYRYYGKVEQKEADYYFKLLIIIQ